jgi:hypothetical protein
MSPSTKTKAKLGAKTAKTAAKNRRARRAALAVVRFAFRVGRPVAKRKVRRRVERIGTTARTAAEWFVVFGPIAAEAAGLVEPPKRRHTGLRVMLGVVLGATAMYFLRGDRRRRGPEPVP